MFLKNFISKLIGKIPLGSPRLGLESNIRMDFKEIDINKILVRIGIIGKPL